MIPKKVLTAMRIVISSTNFSPALTMMSFDKKNNTLVGTDSFLLFEFIPNEPVPCEEFMIGYHSIRALEKLLGTDKENLMTVWGNTKTSEGKDLVHFLAGDTNIYLDIKPLDKVKYPDYQNLGLFEDLGGSTDEINMSSHIKKFQRVCALLSDSPISKITKKYYTFEHKDNHGTYRLGLRRESKE